MDPRPLIIGHRGSSALAPENTLAAFAHAIKDGADGIEFDVHLSRDNVPVVIHDATLTRTANLKVSVSDLSSHELCRTEVGSWFNRRFPLLSRKEYQEATLPSLESVFELFSNSPGLLYLEMKAEGASHKALASVCVTLIRQYSLAARVVVLSFQLAALAQVKILDPGIRTGALFQPRVKQPTSILKRMAVVKKALDCGADEIALHHSLVTRAVVESASQSGLPCVVWTVEHPRWISRAKALGLKALMTNNPAAMIRANS
jgi:glycerophosphoryl diester phosphodiesterase